MTLAPQDPWTVVTSLVTLDEVAVQLCAPKPSSHSLKAVTFSWRQAPRRAFSKNLSKRDPGESQGYNGNCPEKTERCGGRCVLAKIAWASRRCSSVGNCYKSWCRH